MTRIFRYILATDAGMAPCAQDGLVTLATCKPQIRASAVVGDWVLGFAPAPLPRGLVAWAGRVAETLPIGEYERRFRGRRDAVYREKSDGTFRRLRPDYHPEPDAIRKDLAAGVLVFDPAASWYLGRVLRELPPGLMHLAAGGRGHRVNGREPGDTAALERWLRSQSSDAQPAPSSARKGRC
jgi:hypothetical protein